MASDNDYADRFLKMLRAAGNYGVPNFELSKISLQYNHTIWELRHKRGINVKKRKVSKGTYYYYIAEDPKPAPVEKIEIPTFPSDLPEQGSLL